MASSKKYGYQLRGEKLAICELDLTGSGDGLNYTYTEDGGLGLTTDPSSWKSPVESITDGLQIEYLSNEFSLNSNEIPALQYNLFSVNESNFNNIDWITTSEDDSYYMGAGLEYPSQSHPLLLEKIEASAPGGTTSNLLKVTCIETDADGVGPYNTNAGYFYTPSNDLNEGFLYEIKFDIKMNARLDGNTRVVEEETDYSYRPYMQIIDSDHEVIDVDFNYDSSSYSDTFSIKHPDSSVAGSLNTSWANFKISFIMPKDSAASIYFTFPHMQNNNLDSSDPQHYVYIDNLDLSNVEVPDSIIDTDISKAEITLPSYAQKALLDYVRAQESYEGGDLEKWDFFMKQFRSKLERWEDSRITGPRIFGPSGSAIR